MRVSHLEIQRRIRSVKSKISDKQLFTSPLFRGYLTDIAEATGNRYKKPIRVSVDWDDREGASIACTDNEQIYINAANMLTRRLPTRELKMRSIMGFLAHEIGHVIFSDFEGLYMFVEALKSGKFWPTEPTPADDVEENALAEMQTLVFQNPDTKKRGRALQLFAVLAGSIMNIIEDVYVENQMCHKFPGTYRAGIELVAGLLLESKAALSDELEDEKAKPISIIYSMLLQYARSGDVYNPDELENEYTEVLYRCLRYIDNAVYNQDVNARYVATNAIILNIWPFIKKALEEIEEEKEDAEGEGDGSSDKGESSGNNSTGESSDESGEGGKESIGTLQKSKKPSKDGSSGENLGKADEELQKLIEELFKIAKEVGGATEQPIGGNDPALPAGELEKAKSNKENRGNKKLPDTERMGISEENELKTQKVEEVETGRLPYKETKNFTTKGDGTVSRNKSYEGSGYDSSADDIERILNVMAEAKVNVALEKELTKELQCIAENINYGNAHKGVNVRINRMASISNSYIQDYNRISAPLLRLSRRLQKQVAQILKDRRAGGKITGLVYGKRLAARDVVRNDGRYFYNNRLPNDPPEIAVVIVDDESGSMSSKDRATSARAASIVLYDFCRGLNIPVAIYGHTEAKSQVEIYAHADFDTIDNKDKYRLMDISARSGNRDGAALRFAAERLVKRPEPIKLLILISDGQPAGYGGYHGAVAEADLRGIKLEYQRKGINMFAAAIGDDKENIQRIYGEGFLDITDLNKLPMNLCSLLQRYIKAMS